MSIDARAVDLDIATRIERGPDSTFVGTVPPEYVMGPAAWGGYVAALCLRGSAIAAEIRRPATLSVHFLRPGAVGPFDFRARSLRRGRRLESMSGLLAQDGKEIAASLATFVSDDLVGLDHDLLGPPTDLPEKTACPSVGELRDHYGLDHHAPWDQLEVRLQDWSGRHDRDPVAGPWFRFHPVATFADEVVEACRLVVSLDPIIAVTGLRPHTNALVGHSSFPPTADLNVTFHHPPQTAWLFGEAEASISTRGLMAGTVRMWNERNELCATALSTMAWLSADPIVGSHG